MITTAFGTASRCFIANVQNFLPDFGVQFVGTDLGELRSEPS